MISDIVLISNINFICIANDHIISFINFKTDDPKVVKPKQMFNMKNVYSITESNVLVSKHF